MAILSRGRRAIKRGAQTTSRIFRHRAQSVAAHLAAHFDDYVAGLIFTAGIAATQKGIDATRIARTKRRLYFQGRDDSGRFRKRST